MTSNSAYMRRVRRQPGAPQLFTQGEQHDACEAAEALLAAAEEDLRAWFLAALAGRFQTASLQHVADMCAQPPCLGAPCAPAALPGPLNPHSPFRGLRTAQGARTSVFVFCCCWTGSALGGTSIPLLCPLVQAPMHQTCHLRRGRFGSGDASPARHSAACSSTRACASAAAATALGSSRPL